MNQSKADANWAHEALGILASFGPLAHLVHAKSS